MISNCGHDENNKYHGGKAGDQTGGEWSIIKWYNRPWMGVFRHSNKAVRDAMVKMATDAAKNNKVGYDQYQRLTFWEQLKANKYDASKISVACESDCSAGVAAIAKAAGYLCGDTKLQAIPETMYTGNQKTILKKAGFEYMDDAKYLSSDDYLIPGDILYYNKGASGHTVIVLDYGKKTTAEPAPASPVPAPSTKDANEVNSYMVTITSAYLRIRKGPGTNYAMLRTATGGEKYIPWKDSKGNKIKHTIVETSSGTGSKTGWGKLSTGEGWIALDYTKKV